MSPQTGSSPSGLVSNCWYDCLFCEHRTLFAATTSPKCFTCLDTICSVRASPGSPSAPICHMLPPTHVGPVWRGGEGAAFCRPPSPEGTPSSSPGGGPCQSERLPDGILLVCFCAEVKPTSQTAVWFSSSCASTSSARKKGRSASCECCWRLVCCSNSRMMSSWSSTLPPRNTEREVHPVSTSIL